VTVIMFMLCTDQRAVWLPSIGNKLSSYFVRDRRNTMVMTSFIQVQILNDSVYRAYLKHVKRVFHTKNIKLNVNIYSEMNGFFGLISRFHSLNV